MSPQIITGTLSALTHKHSEAIVKIRIITNFWNFAMWAAGLMAGIGTNGVLLAVFVSIGKTAKVNYEV